MTFLNNNPELEEILKEDIGDSVIVPRKDWEAVLSAISFKKVLVMDGTIFSNTNFKYEHGEKVMCFDKQPGSHLIVAGRIHWRTHENDYILIPPSNKNGSLENSMQIPESKLTKYKQ